jgi:hypothetical protein
MKIAKHKRVRVTPELIRLLGFAWWNRWEFNKHLLDNYKLSYTCRRNNLYYYKPLDSYKLAMFLLTYGDYAK